MWWTYAGQAGLGLAAGLVPATYQLATALCGGEKAPEKREEQLAWARWAVALWAAPLFAGTMTDPIVSWGKGWASWPEVAVFVGICGNALWPIIVAATSDAVKAEVKRRMTKAFDALRGAP